MDYHHHPHENQVDEENQWAEINNNSGCRQEKKNNHKNLPLMHTHSYIQLQPNPYFIPVT